MVKNGINYLIDKRILAMDIIILLEEDYYKEMPYLKAKEYPYLNDVRERFKDYIHHAAVEFFHNEWENYAYDEGYTKVLLDEGDEFGKLIDTFTLEPVFLHFYEDHQQYFESVLEKNLAQVMDVDWISTFEQTYGALLNTLEVYFSFTSGGVGYNIGEIPENKIVLGVQRVENEMPLFLAGRQNLNLFFHETSHGYINPVVEETEIDEDIITYYFQKLHPKVQKVYGLYKSMIAEQFVRGFTLHFLESMDREVFEKRKNVDTIEGWELALEIAEDLSQKSYLNYSDYIKEKLFSINIGALK